MIEASEGHITHAVVSVGGAAVLRSLVVRTKLTLFPKTPEYGASLHPAPAGDSHMPKIKACFQRQLEVGCVGHAWSRRGVIRAGT